MKFLEVYTDGACRPNPGKGAWAYCIVEDNKPLVVESGIKSQTTNNEMELTAILEALKHVDENGKYIYLYTDSMYAQKGMEQWMNNWKLKGWNVKNADIWKQIYFYVNRMRGRLNISWVRGHNKNKWNEFVDKLCSETLENVKENG